MAAAESFRAAVAAVLAYLKKVSNLPSFSRAMREPNLELGVPQGPVAKGKRRIRQMNANI